MFSEKVEVSENAMPCNDPAINNTATQGEALARTDARSDHAVLDFFFGYFHLHQGKRK
jgi:hypothetical protein